MQKKNPKNISNEDNQKKKPNLSISFGFLWQKAHFTIYILSNDNLRDHEMIYVSLILSLLLARWCLGDDKEEKTIHMYSLPWIMLILWCFVSSFSTKKCEMMGFDD